MNVSNVKNKNKSNKASLPASSAKIDFIDNATEKWNLYAKVAASPLDVRNLLFRINKIKTIHFMGF